MKKFFKEYWPIIVMALLPSLYFFLILFITEAKAEDKFDQWDKLIFYGEKEECPVKYVRDEYKRYRLLSFNILCEPKFVSSELSILKPKCFYVLVAPPNGLQNTLYSERCYIHLVKEEGEGI